VGAYISRKHIYVVTGFALSVRQDWLVNDGG